MKYFSSGESGSFSKYLFQSVKLMLASLREKENLTNRNAGMKISDDVFKKVRKVKKLEGHFRAFGTTDSEELIEKNCGGDGNR